MIPFGNKIVTLIQREITKDKDGKSIVSYTRYTLNGCSWKTSKSANGNDGAFPQRPSAICRVPATQRKPAIGDVLILGKYSGSIESSTDVAKLLEMDDAIRIVSIGDNSLNGILSHYVCKG